MNINSESYLHMNSRASQIASIGALFITILLFYFNSSFVNSPLSSPLDTGKSLQQYQTQLHRDILRYRNNSINQYDTLNESLEQVKDATDRLARSGSFATDEVMQSLINQIEIAVGEQELLVEQFKTYNAIAQNSLSYFYQLSSELYDSNNTSASNLTLGRLTTLVLEYTNNPTQMRAMDIYPIVDKLNSNPDYRLKSLINHSLMVVEKLPELDAIVEQFNSLNIDYLIEEVLERIKTEQIKHLNNTKYFNIMLLLGCITLIGYIWYLFSDLKRNRNTLAQSNISLNKEVSVRKRTEAALTTLVQDNATDGNSICALLESVKHALKTRCVYISYLDNDEQARLTYINSDKFIEDFVYELQDSPCIDVVNDGRLYYNEGFNQYFRKWIPELIEDAESYFGVAIKNEKNQTIGVLATIDDKAIDNVLLFENILNLAASKATIEIARTESTLKSKRYQQGLLDIENWSASALLHSHEQEELLNKACETALKLTDASLAATPIVAPDNEHFTFIGAKGHQSSKLRKITMSLNGSSLCAHAIRHNEALNIDDIRSDVRSRKLVENKFEVSAAFVTPVNIKNSTYGALTLFKKTGTFNEIDKRLIGQLARSIEILLTNHCLLQDLEAEKERAEVTLHSIGDAVITTNVQGEVEYMNHIAESLTNWGLHQARGLPVQDVYRILDHETREPLHNLVEVCLSHGTAIKKSMITLLSKCDHEREIESSMSPITDNGGNIQGIVIVFHDETEKRHMEHIIRHQATHDALTGLANRNEFDRQLSEHIYDARHKENQQHILCYLDLDRFKLVNDTSGHDAGDELIRQVTRLLQSCLRAGDVIGRLGGDEFGIILENCTSEGGKQIAQKIIDIINDFQFKWDNQIFTIGVSIGMVAINSDSTDSLEVMKLADVACYTAKDAGRNRVYEYQHEDAAMAKRQEEMRWASRISHALDNNKIVLYAQEIRSLQHSETQQHLEILVRMLDDSGEIITPNAFIPAAERYNLMCDVDRYIISNVFYMISKNDHLDCMYSINLSGNSLNDENIADYIRNKITEYHISPDKLCFEITETAAISNIYKTRKFISDIRELGCKFSLDDFGSGLSSFEYLKNLPVDYLKIDGCFVRDMVNNKTDHAMVAAINEIGHVMGISTIAEFAENENIIQTLKEIGVDFVQGYGVHRPAPLEEIISQQLGTINQYIA